jgi:hypothetical protein
MTTNNSIKVKPKEEAAGILSRARTSDESDALATAFNLGST